MIEDDKILIVDDMEVNRIILCELFKNQYDTLEAEDGRAALDLLKKYEQSIRIVLLDIIMPEINGFDVLEEMKANGWMDKIPVILITGDSSLKSAKRGYDYGAADIITKPFDIHIVKQRVENVVNLYLHKNHLESMLEEQRHKIELQAEKLKHANDFLIETLSTIVEFRNLESGQHIKRIRGCTDILLKYLKNYNQDLELSPEISEMIVSASAMHDIGKIAIPDAILLKPGRLDQEEYEIMKTHAVRGCDILESIGYIQDEEYFKYCYEICRWHHERYDGRGYPDGLKGEEIPIWAQVVSVADVFDALVSERVYKAAYEPERAVQMVLNGECGAFSPQLIYCFQMAKGELIQFVTESLDHD